MKSDTLYHIVLYLVGVSLWPTASNAFSQSSFPRTLASYQSLFNTPLKATSKNEDEIAALLEKARQIRAEAAALEGKSVHEAEEEAAAERRRKRDLEAQAAQKRAELRQQRADKEEIKQSDGRFLAVPETFDDQILLAQKAVERAFRDGLTRQIVRFALLSPDQALYDSGNGSNDQSWPGGAKQMYREAAGPLTRALLRQVRTTNGATTSGVPAAPPKVTSQDVWDFDGSAVVTAEASTGPEYDVQALVQPNTDTKYTKDIQTMDEAMKDRLLLLVNPFWRNIESWGFNLLAPKAKQLAQEAIFDRGFTETFCLLQKTVRGEDCLALKVYPYDWQLYAYAESDYWPYAPKVVRLGSTVDEPKVSDFGSLLEVREEFQLSKNMRQLQRMARKD